MWSIARVHWKTSRESFMYDAQLSLLCDMFFHYQTQYTATPELLNTINYNKNKYNKLSL